ncbi:MAG: GGDEF domain-containing protein [Burkholderiales bacterium]
MALDVLTLYWVLMLCNLVMAGALQIAFAGALPNGLAKWSTSLPIQALAWGLFATRDSLPGVSGALAAHFFLSVSLMLQAAALREFRQKPISKWFLCVPPCVIAILYLILGDSAKEVIGYMLQGACAILVLWFFNRDSAEQHGRASVSLSLALGAMAVALVSLAFLSLAAPNADLASSGASLTKSFALLLAAASVLFTSFAYMLLHKDRAEAEMHKLATMDPLTGVFNRRTFIELADRELARCRRSGSPLRLLMMDLDHFKHVNDSLGHMVGDDVLREFSRVVTDCLRREDLLVRYGGEEFCVLLPGADAGTALTLADRIRVSIDNAKMQTRSGPVHVTTSIGICGDDAKIIDSLDSLLICADGALYLAKAAGRNQVVSSLFKSSANTLTEAESRLL